MTRAPVAMERTLQRRFLASELTTHTQVVVMGAGNVLEFGAPQTLLAVKTSAFSDLVRGSRVNRVPSRELLVSASDVEGEPAATLPAAGRGKGKEKGKP